MAGSRSVVPVERTKRLPDDFMSQLTRERNGQHAHKTGARPFRGRTKKEFDNLRSQIVISSGAGARRYPPYAFTEHGVAMLSSVLRSQRAVLVNIEIMRAFVRLR